MAARHSLAAEQLHTGRCRPAPRPPPSPGGRAAQTGRVRADACRPAAPVIDHTTDRPGLLADPDEVRAILVASATAGEAITYSEMLALLGHQFTRPKMRALCKVLGV